MKTYLVLSVLLVTTLALGADKKCAPPPAITIYDVPAAVGYAIGDLTTLSAERMVDGGAFKDDEPLQFADVRLYSGSRLVHSTKTDSHGYFQLRAPRVGSYTLVFKAMGTFKVEVLPPHITQHSQRSFSSNHGCLSWGSDTN